MEKIKKAFTSEAGMKIVNTLFVLSAFIRNRGIIFIAYIVWIVYLTCCIKHTSSKASATIYKIFVAFAAVMILVNAYFYFMSR